MTPSYLSLSFVINICRSRGFCQPQITGRWKGWGDRACVCVSVCVSVCERDRGRGKERGRESLWLCLCLGNGVLVYLCGCVLGALQTSGVLKARQKVRSRMSWMSPVSPYRVSAAVTFNPCAVCEPQLEPPCPAAVPASQGREGREDSRAKEAERDWDQKGFSPSQMGLWWQINHSPFKPMVLPVSSSPSPHSLPRLLGLSCMTLSWWRGLQSEQGCFLQVDLVISIISSLSPPLAVSLPTIYLFIKYWKLILEKGWR